MQNKRAPKKKKKKPKPQHKQIFFMKKKKQKQITSSKLSQFVRESKALFGWDEKN